MTGSLVPSIHFLLGKAELIIWEFFQFLFYFFKLIFINLIFIRFIFSKLMIQFLPGNNILVSKYSL